MRVPRALGTPLPSSPTVCAVRRVDVSHSAAAPAVACILFHPGGVPQHLDLHLVRGNILLAATSVVQVNRRGSIAWFVWSVPTLPEPLLLVLCPVTNQCVRMILSEICSGSLRL